MFTISVNVQQQSILFNMIWQQNCSYIIMCPLRSACAMLLVTHTTTFCVWLVSRHRVHAKSFICRSESYSNKMITEIEMQTSFTVSQTKHLLKWQEKGRCEEDSRDDGKSTSMLLLTFISHQKASRLCKQIPKSLRSFSSFLLLWPRPPSLHSSPQDSTITQEVKV